MRMNNEQFIYLDNIHRKFMQKLAEISNKYALPFETYIYSQICDETFEINLN
jgi:RNase P subunit RPR2